jgi:hypothetical protein
MQKLEFIRESSGEYRSECGRFRIDKDDRQWWTASYKGVAIAYERGYPEAEAAAEAYKPNLAAEIDTFTKEVKDLKEPQEGLVDALGSLRHACSQAMMRLNDATILTLPFRVDEMVVRKMGLTNATLSFIVSIGSNPYNVSGIRLTTAPATAKKQASKINLRNHDLGKEIAFLRHLRDDDVPVWDSKRGAWVLPW